VGQFSQAVVEFVDDAFSDGGAGFFQDVLDGGLKDLDGIDAGGGHQGLLGEGEVAPPLGGGFDRGARAVGVSDAIEDGPDALEVLLEPLGDVPEDGGFWSLGRWVDWSMGFR